MNDMRSVIVPKSDQINTDDLLGGPMTITITDVSIRPGTEQPVSISFEGDNGKPYRPCKSMARVMVACWGPDANQYKGRSMTLYCDPKVTWAGMAVGGIRISHMTHINGTQTMALTATRGNKKPFTVQPLAVEKKGKTWPELLNEIEAQFVGATDREAVDAVLATDSVQKALEHARNGNKERLDAIIKTATDRTAPIENAPEHAPTDPEAERAASFRQQIAECQTEAEVTAFARNPAVKRKMDEWRKARPELFKSVDDAVSERTLDLGPAPGVG